MKINDRSTQQVLINRLNRLEGQIRGIKSMVQENRDCAEIMQQIAAARSALHGASLVFLKDTVSQCMRQKRAADTNPPELVDELMKMFKNT